MQGPIPASEIVIGHVDEETVTDSHHWKYLKHPEVQCTSLMYTVLFKVEAVNWLSKFDRAFDCNLLASLFRKMMPNIKICQNKIWVRFLIHILESLSVRGTCMRREDGELQSPLAFTGNVLLGELCLLAWTPPDVLSGFLCWFSQRGPSWVPIVGWTPALHGASFNLKSRMQWRPLSPGVREDLSGLPRVLMPRVVLAEPKDRVLTAGRGPSS